MTKTVGFCTLGCKVNQYETQAMEQLLRERGWEIRGFEENNDVYVVNTCSVTAVADKKNRAVIRRCRREHPEAVIAVCGCYPQHDAEAVRALGVDLIGGSADREGFVRALTAAAEGRPCEDLVDDPRRRRSFEILPAGGLEERTRAMLKVQDGCVNFCTYCIIPYTRGPVRSEPVERAVAQARALAAQGYREIVLTGIEIASWGVDLPGKPSLSQLIGPVCAAVPDCRVRLGSLEPRVITQNFCLEMEKYPNLCPHFHLSLQSGCDEVLRRMGRKYDTARYLESVALLRRHFPDCAVTTDLIVAFPGETEAEFAETLAFLRRCAFADVHVFPYSRRPGTVADRMPQQHGNGVKEARSRQAIGVARELNEAFRRSRLGKIDWVLFEQPEGELDVGHTPNYIKVSVPRGNYRGRVLPVRLTALTEEGLLGELVQETN